MAPGPSRVEQWFTWRYLVGFVHPASTHGAFHVASFATIALIEAELEAFATEVSAGSQWQIVLFSQWQIVLFLD